PVPLRRVLAAGRPAVACSAGGPGLAARGRPAAPLAAGAARPPGGPRVTTTHPGATASTPDAGAALSHLLGSSRPVSWINTAYPFAAAYLLAGGGVTTTLVVGTLWLLIPYNLLMYGVNDVFDYESDLRNPRKGGIEGVVLPRR